MPSADLSAQIALQEAVAIDTYSKRAKERMRRSRFRDEKIPKARHQPVFADRAILKRDRERRRGRFQERMRGKRQRFK